MRISLFLFICVLGFDSYTQLEFADSLSAKDAVFTALKNNYDIQASNAQIDISHKNNTWSEAGLFPTVNLNVGYNNTIQDNSNNPFTFTPGVILSRNLSPNLALNLNLFSGFAVKISKERLEKLEEQSKGNALLVIESTILDVLKAYYSARAQYDRLMILNQLKSNAEDRYQYSQIKNKYASSTSLEELQFKNQYFSDSTNALVQEYSYKNAIRNLYLLMNDREITEAISLPFLSDSLNFNFPIIDFNQAQEGLRTDNQQLKNQVLGIELQQLNTSFQKSFLYPTLSLQGAFAPSKSWFKDMNNTFDPIETEVLTYNGSVNLRYTIFNNWKGKRAVEVSKIQESISLMNYENMKKKNK
jgi:outer membrane protein TolC